MNLDQISELNQLCNNIQNADRSVRQNSLKKLLELSTTNSEQAATLFDQCYLHIIKCYADKFESCRCLAVEIISNLLNTLPNNNFYVEVIVPVLTRRIGQKEIIEESEELRLQLVQQLLKIVNKFAATELKGDQLKNVYNDVMDILLKTLRDPFVNVQRECCSIVKSLVTATPSFHCRAESLADPLIALLKHRQWLSRSEAISALGVLALHVNNGDNVLKIVMSISPLLMDSIPQIRLECGRVGCLWLLQLRDRYSFFERILPLILCCLNDDHQFISNEIKNLWMQCGKQYFNENENELSKIELVDHFPSKYPNNVERPTLGCRAIVQRSLRVVTIIVKELVDWKEEVRLHSLKLLWQVVLHSEKSATAKFIEIFPILSMSCMDQEQAVFSEGNHVAELMGMLLDYESWKEHALNGLEKSPNLGVLNCFSALYSGASDEKVVDTQRILMILQDTNICHSLKPKYQESLLMLTDMLVDAYLNSTVESSVENMTLNDDHGSEELLYTILVKVTSLAAGNEKLQDFGKEILEKLARGQQNVRKLHFNYMGRLLESIEDLDSENSDLSDVIILLHGLIVLSGFQKEYLESMKRSIKLVLYHATPNAKIKILAAISKSMLNWEASLDLPTNESHNLLRKFVQDIIEPILIWRAGRSSESIRAMATTALYSLSEGISGKCTIFSDMATHFVSLIEDRNVVTRAYAVRCVRNSSSFRLEQLKPIVFAVLSRLDDPSAEVREYAAQCIGELQLNVDSNTDIDSWKVVLHHIFSNLILHLDGPEINLRKMLLASIHKLASNKMNTDVFVKVVVGLPASHPHREELEEIKNRVTV